MITGLSSHPQIGYSVILISSKLPEVVERFPVVILDVVEQRHHRGFSFSIDGHRRDLGKAMPDWVGTADEALGHKGPDLGGSRVLYFQLRPMVPTS